MSASILLLVYRYTLVRTICTSVTVAICKHCATRVLWSTLIFSPVKVTDPTSLDGAKMLGNVAFNTSPFPKKLYCSGIISFSSVFWASMKGNTTSSNSPNAKPATLYGPDGWTTLSVFASWQVDISHKCHSAYSSERSPKLNFPASRDISFLRLLTRGAFKIWPPRTKKLFFLFIVFVVDNFTLYGFVFFVAIFRFCFIFFWLFVLSSLLIHLGANWHNLFA